MSEHSESGVAEVELGVFFPTTAERRGVPNHEAVLACQTRDLADSVMAFADDAVLMERDCGPWRPAQGDEGAAKFDRWLAKHDAEVAAKALRDAVLNPLMPSGRACRALLEIALEVEHG